MSCRYAAAENGSKTSVPLRNTRRTPLTSPTDVLSIEIQSIVGCGVPEAEQSNHPPDEFEKSNRDGGSITKLGPLRCDSYISAYTFPVIFLGCVFFFWWHRTKYPQQ